MRICFPISFIFGLHVASLQCEEVRHCHLLGQDLRGSWNFVLFYLKDG